MVSDELVIGVELGGTKAIAVLSRGREILERVSFPTTSSDETLGAVRATLDQWLSSHRISGLGIATFGPVQLDRHKPEYGSILATPKPGWSGAQVAARLSEGVYLPWAIDTDVNAAAMAEHIWGGAQAHDPLCYITMGTGVGGGLMAQGACVHGAMHPEIGHLRLRRSKDDLFEGACSFHGDCIEGLISGPALAKRFGRDAQLVSDEEPAWRHVASDIAELCGAILLTTSAQRIVFGGSVALSRPFLLDKARRLLVERLGDYLPYLTASSARSLVRSAALGPDAGPLGAVALGLRAAQEDGAVSSA